MATYPTDQHLQKIIARLNQLETIVNRQQKTIALLSKELKKVTRNVNSVGFDIDSLKGSM